MKMVLPLIIQITTKMQNYFLINGEEVASSSPYFTPESRGYRFGDGFFESMRFINNRIYHLPLHVIRIRKSAMLLQIDLPENFDEDWMEKQIVDFCKNHSINNAFVRFTFLRDAQGRYLPEQSNCEIIAEITPATETGFTFNEIGLKLGSFKELSKNSNFISTLKTTSSLMYVLASLYAKKNLYDDCVVYNDYGRIAETSRANIFVVSGEFVITPPISEYCIDGVMRKVVLQLADAYGYTISEQPLSEMHLQAADEIFITNAARGIQWVQEYKNKKYRNTCSKVLSELLNKSITL